jgi:nucleoside-diphosphate-sugar epimerase
VTTPESAKDYLYVLDTVDALIHIGLESAGGVYNVASGRNVTHRELASELHRITGCTIEFDGEGRTVTFPPIDNARLTAEFPFSPRPVLDELPALVDDCRDWLTRSAASGAER